MIKRRAAFTGLALTVMVLVGLVENGDGVRTCIGGINRPNPAFGDCHSV